MEETPSAEELHEIRLRALDLANESNIVRVLFMNLLFLRSGMNSWSKDYLHLNLVEKEGILISSKGCSFD